MSDPFWWRQGWVPYAVLVLVAAAADLCFPMLSTPSVLSPTTGGSVLGLGTGIGVLLLITAILMLRKDFTRREQVFLGALAAVGFLGQLVSGSIPCWMVVLPLPFCVIIFGPGKALPAEPGVEYRNWFRYWMDRRKKIQLSGWTAMLPTIMSVLIGVVAFVAFLCIFATGNPVVQLVWETLVSWWNALVEYLQISWDFCMHVIVWGVGICAFALFTVRRPSSDVTSLPEIPAEGTDGTSLLPHLPLTVLLGVNLAFLIATASDVAFLWFRNVPEGISQTDYLYEGVGAIVWASMLAAGLLLFFFRSSGSVRRTVVPKALGYALLVQTLLLAVSVYVRLYNQVLAYSFSPRRIQAAECLLLGVAGLIILLCYMRSRGGFLRHTRICLGTLGLMTLVFTVNPPASLSGDLNLRYAAGHPEWRFSIQDFRQGCFSVEDNLPFALYVYEQEKNAIPAGVEWKSLSDDWARRMVHFEASLRNAAIREERNYGSWRGFTLRGYWNRPAAEVILGRPIAPAKVEPVH